jgi:UDP-N-acetylmuramate--alanine ligase
MKSYFIGMGGIGVSALAKFYLDKGWIVSGSDISRSSITTDLTKRGVEVIIGEQVKENIKDYDLVIYSPAVKEDNPELKEARSRGIKTMSYPQALGVLTREYFTIAISGTHGKSTTTAMLALILIKAGLDPTVIVGTKVREFGDSNYYGGKSKYLVIEACEHEASFLNYWPKIIVVNNIEEEHLDYYSNLENIQKAFNEFVSHMDKDGILIKEESVKIDREAISFSLNDKEAEGLGKIMKVPGKHNILNALAALNVARVLGVKDEVSFEALGEYLGSWRRFEVTQLPKFILIDDYAHHPTEIKATLRAARDKYPYKSIVCVFQPHQYQRTKLLFNDFVSVFQEALEENIVDRLLLIDVYDVKGREGAGDEREYTSERLALSLDNKRAKRIADVELKQEIEGADIVIMMGAGDIYNLSEELREACRK